MTITIDPKLIPITYQQQRHPTNYNVYLHGVTVARISFYEAKQEWVVNMGDFSSACGSPVKRCPDKYGVDAFVRSELATWLAILLQPAAASAPAEPPAPKPQEEYCL